MPQSLDSSCADAQTEATGTHLCIAWLGALGGNDVKLEYRASYSHLREECVRVLREAVAAARERELSHVAKSVFDHDASAIETLDHTASRGIGLAESRPTAS